MRIRWRGLELPSQVVRDEEVSTPTYGRFLIEPFERGFGTTVGNSLRRILLSSLEGSAIAQVKLAGTDHEFTTLPGVMEDVTDIILNVKSLILRISGDGEKTMKVSRNEPGEVRAGDIEAEAGVEILNPDLVLATLTDHVEFSMEMKARTGRGFSTAEENTPEEEELGIIPVDSVYSPVTRVRYKTEDTRVGQRTNYDRLIVEIWTDGSIRPEDALVEAAKILRKHLNPFVQYNELGDQTAAAAEKPSMGVSEATGDEWEAKLAMSIQDLDLSVRASNCLESARVMTVRKLVQMTEADLLKVRSFGKTSLREVKRKLADLGLELGMKLDQRPTEGNSVNAAVMTE